MSELVDNCFNSLLQRVELTEEIWYQLIGELLKSIKTHLRYFHLEKLGNVTAFINGSSIVLSESKGHVEIFLDGLSLSTQGIYWQCSCKFTPARDDGPTPKYFWGISRQGHFICGTLLCEMKKENDSHIFQSISEIRLQKISLEALCKLFEFSPEEIWNVICKCVKDWERSLKGRYDVASRLMNSIASVQNAIDNTPDTGVQA